MKIAAVDSAGRAGLCRSAALRAGNDHPHRHGALDLERRRADGDSSKGYFKEAGIKLEIEDIDSSANVIALLAQGQLNMVAGGISAGYLQRASRRTCRSPSCPTASRRRSGTT